MDFTEKEKPANENGGHSNTHILNTSPEQTKSQWEYQQEFEQAIRQAGIDLTDKIIADRRLHRFKPGGKGNPDAWYCFHGLAGAFGDWKQGIKEKWGTQNPSLTPKQREQMQEQTEKARKSLQEESRRKNQEAAERALKDWHSFSEEGQSPYLTKKKVDALGLRFGDEFMAMPIKDVEGKLWSYQKIYPNGKKYLLEGGRKKSCFHTLGILEDQKPLYVTEGYATGASVHMATDIPTVIAIDSGNLESVVCSLRKKYPKSAIVIAGDDDWFRESNVGTIKAQEAAQKHGCSVIFPVFKDKEQYAKLADKEKPTDFNDLHCLEKLEEVKKQIFNPKQTETGVATPSCCNIANATQTLTEKHFEIATSFATDSIGNIAKVSQDYSECFEQEGKFFKTKAIVIQSINSESQEKLSEWFPSYAIINLSNFSTVEAFPRFVKEGIILSIGNDESTQKSNRKLKRFLHSQGQVVSIIECPDDITIASPLKASDETILKQIIEKAQSELELPSTLSQWTKASDLFKYQLQENESLIHGLLPKIGVSILGGHPKSGKSWMAINLIKSILKGEEAFGLLPTQKIGVLYLSLEDNSARIRDRLRMVFGEDIECLINLEIKTISEQFSYQTLQYLKETLEAKPWVKLLIVDPLQKVRAAPDKANDAYQKDYKDMSAIKKLAEEREISILLIHHLRKEKNSTESDLSSLNGSMGLSGSADSILLLKKEDQNTFLKITGKDVEDRTLSLVFDQETGRFSINDEEKQTNNALQSDIIVFLKKAKGLVLLKEIYAGLGIDEKESNRKSYVRNQLKVLEKKQIVVCLYRGAYKINSSDSSFATLSGSHVATDVASSNSHEIKVSRPICNMATSDYTFSEEIEEMDI